MRNANIKYWRRAAILPPARLRKEGHKFKASLRYKVRPYLSIGDKLCLVNLSFQIS